MKTEQIKTKLEDNGYKFDGIIFLEDGYEVRFRPKEKHFEDTVLNEQYEEKCMEKIYELVFEGFIVSEQTVDCHKYKLTLVPKALDEMTDFLWKYVEKYGRKDQVLADIIWEAFSVIEKAIDNIPDSYEEKNVAKENYERFVSMI